MKKKAVDSPSETPVEHYIQDIAAKLLAKDNQTFAQDLRKTQAVLNSRLILMKSKLSQNDLIPLETLAQEISHDALKIGAIGILDIAIKMQGAVRGQNDILAFDIMQQLESEMTRLDEYLADESPNNPSSAS